MYVPLSFASQAQLNVAWGMEDSLDLQSFRENLSLQMLEYNPSHCKYPHDFAMRASTQQSQHQQQVAAQDLTIW
jgi:hypothetical protein